MVLVQKKKRAVGRLRERASSVGVPTLERLKKADNHFVVGDDQRGGKIYQFCDSTMDRLYSRLTKAVRTRSEEEALRREYIALQRYKHHWYHGGLQASVGSVDLNRVFASDPGSMSGMAKSEKQAHHRKQWRAARELLGHQPGIVIDNIVCCEHSLEVGGYSIGYASPYRAREAARDILRKAGQDLANMWGIG